MIKLIIILLVSAPSFSIGQGCTFFIGEDRSRVAEVIKIVSEVTGVKFKSDGSAVDSTAKNYFNDDGVGFTKVQITFNIENTLVGTEVIKKQTGIADISIKSSKEYIKAISARVNGLFATCESYQPATNGAVIGKYYTVIKSAGSYQGIALDEFIATKSGF